MRTLSRNFSRLRLRNITSLFLMVNLTLSTLAQDNSPQLRAFQLRAGPWLQLSLLTPLDSGRAQVGDELSWSLDEDLIVAGAIVLPSGSTIHGRVTSVRRAGKNCKSGWITFELAPVRTQDG